MTAPALMDRRDPVWDCRHWMHRHLLYRCYDAAGRLLYVGASSDWPQRVRAHTYGTHWWNEAATFVMKEYPDRASAFEAEREAIATEQPRYNINSRRAARVERAA